MKLRVILLMLPLVLAVSFAQGQTLYKWIDADGNVSYHDLPPPSGAGYRVEAKNIRRSSRSDADDPANEAAKKYPVVLYSASNCVSCDSARAYLVKRKIPFKENNVEGNRELLDELKAKTGSLAVPTIMVGDKVMKGYLESLLEGELDQAGYPKMKPTASGSGETAAGQ